VNVAWRLHDDPVINSVVNRTLAYMPFFVAIVPCTDRLKALEEKTGYPKVYFFLFFAILFKIMVFVLGGAKLVVDLVGFVYPAYMSFKSMDTLSEEASRQWLTYWVVFASLAVSEQLASFIVAWIPFYFYIKICFLVWLYHPKFLGAQTIYSQVIRPVILPYLEMAGTKVTKKAE
jgi:receptor expression-enhancing protein 5/6